MSKFKLFPPRAAHWHWQETRVLVFSCLPECSTHAKKKESISMPAFANAQELRERAPEGIAGQGGEARHVMGLQQIVRAANDHYAELGRDPRPESRVAIKHFANHRANFYDAPQDRHVRVENVRDRHADRKIDRELEGSGHSRLHSHTRMHVSEHSRVASAWAKLGAPSFVRYQNYAW